MSSRDLEVEGIATTTHDTAGIHQSAIVLDGIDNGRRVAVIDPKGQAATGVADTSNLGCRVGSTKQLYTNSMQIVAQSRGIQQVAPLVMEPELTFARWSHAVVAARKGTDRCEHVAVDRIV